MTHQETQREEKPDHVGGGRSQAQVPDDVNETFW